MVKCDIIKSTVFANKIRKDSISEFESNWHSIKKIL